MFTERYFTEKDARAVQALLSLFFPILFHVRYVGIYGEPGTPGKFAYSVTFQGEKRAHQIGRLVGVTVSIWVKHTLLACHCKGAWSLLS